MQGLMYCFFIAGWVFELNLMARHAEPGSMRS